MNWCMSKYLVTLTYNAYLSSVVFLVSSVSLDLFPEVSTAFSLKFNEFGCISCLFNEINPNAAGFINPLV